VCLSLLAFLIHRSGILRVPNRFVTFFFTASRLQNFCLVLASGFNTSSDNIKDLLRENEVVHIPIQHLFNRYVLIVAEFRNVLQKYIQRFKHSSIWFRPCKVADRCKNDVRDNYWPNDWAFLWIRRAKWLGPWFARPLSLKPSGWSLPQEGSRRRLTSGPL
jgi:hypothetical protein